MPQTDTSCLDLNAKLGRNYLRSSNPGLAANAGQQREARIVGDIKRRELLSVVLDPDVRKMGPGHRVRLEVELSISLEFRERLVRSNSAAAIALSQFDAVSIELIVHKLDSGEEVPSPLCTPIRIAKELRQIGAGVVFTHARPEARCLRPRLDLGVALHRAIDHLAPDRLALIAVAVEEAVVGATRQDQRKLPGEVVAVLDGGILNRGRWPVSDGARHRPPQRRGRSDISWRQRG